MPTYELFYSVALVALIAVNPGHAAAQEADETGQKRLGTVTVTSQKREQSLQDVPLSVAALTGEDLADQQISSVADLSQLAPSVTYSQSTNPTNSSLNIRGVGTSVFSAAVEPSVSFIVDGVVLARQGQALADLIDIERVEILRGPQSTLFGKNASAGVVSITTKDASDKFEGSIEALAAEFDEYQLKGTVSGPLGAGVRGRLTGFYNDVGGHIDNVFDGRDLNGRTSVGARGKLQWDASDKLDFTLIADWRESDDDCCMWQHRRVDDPFLANAIMPVVPSDSNTQTNVDSDVRNETSQWGASLAGHYDFGKSTLTSIVAYREWDFSNTIDIDGSPSQGDSSLLTGGLIALDVNDNDSHLSQFSQELRLASNGDGPVNYVVGAYYSNLDYGGTFQRRFCLLNVNTESCPDTLQFFVQVAPGVLFPVAIPGARSGMVATDIENTNYAVFGQVDWALNDRFTLSTGLRAQSDESDFGLDTPYEAIVPGDTITAIPTPDGSPDGPDNPNRSVLGTVSDDAVTGKLALQYAFAEDVNGYVSYTRGYKGPAADPDITNGSVRQIDPETSDAWEVGFKSVLAGGLATFNVAVFDVSYADYQGQTFDPETSGFRLANVGEVSTQGVETEFSALLSQNLLANFSAAYTNAKIDSFPNGECYSPESLDPGCVNGHKDLSGGDLPNSPDWSVNVGGRYNVELESLPFDMFLSGNYRWQDKVQFSLNQNPNTIQDSYGVFDASIGFEDHDGRYKVTIFGKNLFDQSFAGIMFEDPLRTDAVVIDQYIPKSAQRYFGISVRVDF